MDNDEDECEECGEGICGPTDLDSEMIPPKYFMLFNTFHLLAALFRAFASWFVGSASYVAERGELAQKKIEAAEFADNLKVFDND